MLPVILGAGASYDSDPNRSPARYLEPASTIVGGYGLRPPLAKDLFAPRDGFGKLLDQYPRLQSVVPRLRRAAIDPSVPIEYEFELIIADARNRIETQRQLAALRLYLSAAVRDATIRWASMRLMASQIKPCW
jgi:hypothetical protein